MALPGRMIYGTAWKKDRTASLVKAAVRSGFRAIDTACQPKHYHQPGVGEALSTLIREDGLKREELFIQTKYTSPDGQDLSKPLPYDRSAPLTQQVQQSFQTSLKELQTDYIDSLLLHSPERTVSRNVEALLALQPFLHSGQLKHIGISNIYDLSLIQQVVVQLEQHEMKINFIQNRFYDATRYDLEIRKYCRENGIVYQSFWTLTANPHILADKAVRNAANRLGFTPEQTFYLFCIQEGITPLNGTTNETRMKLGVEVMLTEAQLSERERDNIRRLLV